MQDPFDQHNDATLNNALRCAYLSERYRLDSIVEDEGSNFSVGERSLVSLARALVKNSRIVVSLPLKMREASKSTVCLPNSVSMKLQAPST